MISTTEFYQFAKLPVLVEHFIEHREQNHKLTLWQFLNMHYADEDVKDPDYDKDMKLPFKSHDGFLNITVFTPIPINYTICVKPIDSETQNFTLYTDSFVNSGFLGSIWQPPKFC